jgi:hypothetical protein
MSGVASYTYTGDPEVRSLDKVRFLIGDTLSSDWQFSDAEISSLLTTEGSPLSAAVAGAHALAAKYARLIDTSTGDISKAFSQRMENYKELAKRLKERLAVSSGDILVDNYIDNDSLFSVNMMKNNSHG